MTWFLGSGDAGLDMAEDGDVNGDGIGDEGVGFDHLGKAPPLCETKKVHKKQFWETSAHSFGQGSATWFLGSGDTGGDVDADGDVNMAVDNTHGVRDWDKFGIRIRYGYCEGYGDGGLGGKRRWGW